MSEITVRDRFRGCLLGLAAGDALGTTLEFKRPGTFEPIDDMIGGGPCPAGGGPMDRRHVDGPVPGHESHRDGRLRPHGPDAAIRALVS